MSRKKFQKCIVFIMLSILLTWNNRTSAESSCMSVIATMFSCMDYITGGNCTRLPSSCCSALANVVDSQPQCLCWVLGGDAASSLGFVVNRTRALQLPSSCNVKTPPVSKCNGGGVSGAPASSPMGVPGQQYEGPSADFPSGLNLASRRASDGSITKSSLHILAFILSCASAFAIF